MIKILMIINEFPPTGESGVQRPLKFLKYISRFHWKPIVITPRIAPKNVFDYSLVNEIPENTELHKTYSWGIKAKRKDYIADIKFIINNKSTPAKQILWMTLKFINDLMFPIDKQIGWVPFAYFKAVQLIKKENIRNIYITAFPFSALIIGVMLKIKFKDNIFLVSDYRDAWQFEPNLSRNVLPFRKKIMRYFDNLTLKKSDFICFNTDFVKQQYCNNYPYLISKCIALYNGFDEEDFKNIKAKKFETRVMLYMGKAYSQLRTPIHLIRALNSMNLKNFEYIHIGTISKELEQQIVDEKLTIYKYLGYKSHSEALNYAAGANYNVLLTNNDKDSEGVIAGKLFELLRLGKPILALGPKNSLVKDFIIKTNSGIYAFIEDEEDIKQALDKLFEFSHNNINISVIDEYSRENLTKKLLSLYKR